MLASVWMMKMGKKALKSIKNLMSDRCTVQKKFTDEVLQSYRQSILPQVVEDCTNLFSEVEQLTKVSRMNDLFCGLHYIVGLACRSSRLSRGSPQSVAS